MYICHVVALSLEDSYSGWLPVYTVLRLVLGDIPFGSCKEIPYIRKAMLVLDFGQTEMGTGNGQDSESFCAP